MAGPTAREVVWEEAREEAAGTGVDEVKAGELGLMEDTGVEEKVEGVGRGGGGGGVRGDEEEEEEVAAEEVSGLAAGVTAGGGGGTLGIETREKGAGFEVWGCLEVHFVAPPGARGTG